MLRVNINHVTLVQSIPAIADEALVSLYFPTGIR